MDLVLRGRSRGNVGRRAYRTGRRPGRSDAEALRYYERVDLLPEPDRTEAGYRDYSDTVFDRLRFIRSAQPHGRWSLVAWRVALTPL